MVRCEGFLLWRLPYAPGGADCGKGYCTAPSGLSPGPELEPEAALGTPRPTPAAAAATSEQRQPTGLMTDYQAAAGDTALGVSACPLLSWIVPACGGDASRPFQVGYRIHVSEERALAGSLRNVLHWDSGRVLSNASVNVAYNGPALAPGAVYIWNVTTWTGESQSLPLSANAACQSAASAPSRFVTALFAGWDRSARWIWTSNDSTNAATPGGGDGAAPAPDDSGRRQQAQHTRFAFFRRVVDVAGDSACAPRPAAGAPGLYNDTRPPLRALLFASASVDPNILSSFKIYLGGLLVAIGPGRGEMRVRDGDSTVSHSSYVTVDVTKQLATALGGAMPDGASSHRTILAVEGQSPGQDTSWDAWDPYADEHGPLAAPAVLLQLQISRVDGTRCTVTTESGSGRWLSAPADDYYNPSPNKATMYGSFVENTDARLEPVGWRADLEFASQQVHECKIVERAARGVLY